LIRIAVVEDEPQVHKQMEEYLLRYQQERGVKVQAKYFTDGDELVEGYRSEYDIVLLDVQMQFLDGMTTARLIREVDEDVIIIFVSNMSQYAIEGYKVGALDFVLKPVTYFALSQRLDKAAERLEKRKKRYISIAREGSWRKLELGQVYYIDSQNHTLLFHTRQGDFPVSGTMQRMEKDLTPYGVFFRCSKGYLVNLEHIEAIRDNCAVVNGQMLPISRGKKGALMAALTDYLNGVIRG
jgi:DNA-binding LytR/AlgR family response regulator